ncbi:high affinity methionine permease [Ganoderma leucocontextum]|nr:high affinity methionine permease [Ganoderma leucocontextum]
MSSILKFLPTSRRQESSDDAASAIPGEQVDVKGEKSGDSESEELPEGDLNPGGLSLEEDAAGGMGRHLGVFSCTLLIVGRIIGTGIFSTPSSILGSVGSVGASFMLWVAGFILSFCGLFIWLEFGTMIPRSGGEKVYLEAVYKKPKYLVTVIFAANAILLGFTASGCIVFAQNILVTAGHTADRWVTRGIALGVIAFVTLLHGLTPRLGVWVMNGLSVFKIGILVFIVVTGWAVLAGHTSIQDPHANFRDAFAGSSHSSNDYATAMFKVLNAYAGWSNVNYVLNNVKNPVRTLKIAGPLGLSICAVLYLLANVSYFAAATKDEIRKSGVTVASLFFLKVFGAKAQKALTVFVALRLDLEIKTNNVSLAPATHSRNVVTITFAASRVNQELAKEGIPLPFGSKFWASNWPTGKSPLPGLIVHLIPSIIIILGPPPAVAYPFILDVEGYPGQIINFFIVIGLFWLRYHKPKTPRPFKVWLPVAVFFLAASVFLLVAPFLRPANRVGDTPPLPYYLYCLVGIAIMAAGVLYWALWRVVPRWFGYDFVPRKEKLSDGTVVTVFSTKKLD